VEVHNLVDFLKRSGFPTQYTEEVTTKYQPGQVTAKVGTAPDEVDVLFEEAVRLVCQFKRASASFLQRRFSIGYNRAARILDQLEEAGVIGPADGAKPREILINNPDEFLNKWRSSSE
jgi:S-DNA-T family DNA segregation ATPase FtsK/SpoIIIE